MQTRILLDRTPAPDGRQLVRMLIRLTGTPPQNGARAPLNVALVLDRSGSMAGEKLEAAREAATQLVRRLWPEDVASVVAYDDEVTTVAEPAAGESQPDLSVRIAAIGAGGMTNLSGGWLRGRELAARNAGDGRISRVVLLTDGLANVGVTEPDTLAALCETARASGITTTAIGFGEGYDERLLQRMADAGGGALYYIERPDQAAAIFAEELSDLLATTAQNVSVTIEPSGNVELAAVRHAYPSTRDGAALRLEIGDIYAREPRTLLVELLVAAGLAGVDGADGVIDVAVVTVRGDVIDGRSVRSETIRLPVTIDATGEPRVEPEIEHEALILAAAAARAEALEQRERGDYGAAGATLRSIAASLAASRPEDALIRDEIEDLEQAAAALEGDAFDEADAKYLFQLSSDSVRGRAAKSELIRRRRPPQSSDA